MDYVTLKMPSSCMKDISVPLGLDNNYFLNTSWSLWWLDQFWRTFLGFEPASVGPERLIWNLYELGSLS